jgi:hypothetical protein
VENVTVSVVGTVFLVSAEEEGSRVAVIEGEVRVKQGTTEKSWGNRVCSDLRWRTEGLKGQWVSMEQDEGTLREWTVVVCSTGRVRNGTHQLKDRCRVPLYDRIRVDAVG